MNGLEEDVAVTPPARRAGRVKTGVTPKTTPAKAKVEDVPLPLPLPIVTSASVPQSSASIPSVSSGDQDSANPMGALGRVSLGDAFDGNTTGIANSPSVATVNEQFASSIAIRPHDATNPLSTNATIAPDAQTEQQKIFLRFSRPSPPITTTPSFPATSSLYPSIPGLPAARVSTDYRDREASVDPSTESEGEYTSAKNRP